MGDHSMCTNNSTDTHMIPLDILSNCSCKSDTKKKFRLDKTGYQYGFRVLTFKQTQLKSNKNMKLSTIFDGFRGQNQPSYPISVMPKHIYDLSKKNGLVAGLVIYMRCWKNL